jgi:hypothetical protein
MRIFFLLLITVEISTGILPDTANNLNNNLTEADLTTNEVK